MTVIDGGLAPFRLDNGALLHIVPDDEVLPFIIDTAVTEQDTWLALGPARDVLIEDGNPLRTITQAHDVAPRALGSVDVRGGEPVLLRAIVIDVDAEPCCTAASVEAAARAILRVVLERRLARIRVPLLGTERGRLDVIESASAIVRGLGAQVGHVDVDVDVDVDGHVEFALVVPAGRQDDVRAALRA